ncbi:DUF1801 domain-containing protein [Lentibacillus sediminis]|uniref:DUF1801 domain-containing protein n=1 Tax=Lentibacillus sediminis TaxID=1940529 RepID=UPI000C1B7FF2|nr:DUF1801 domain-containing protein [Lentibacillus sediminis]
MTQQTSEKVDQFIQEQPEHPRQLMNRLRKILLESSETITEEIKWNMPCYLENGNVCYLQPAKAHVNLGFYHGASLQDPDSLLQGTGKTMRHIRIKNPKDIQPEKFTALIQEAIRLNQ